jgi:hypothetical protein
MIDERIAAVLVMRSPLDAVRPALAAIACRWPTPRGAYPHAGHWERPNWTFEDLPPSVMADHAEAWVRDGARIVGGRGWTRPDHIRGIRDRLASPRAMRNAQAQRSSPDRSFSSEAVDRRAAPALQRLWLTTSTLCPSGSSTKAP